MSKKPQQLYEQLFKADTTDLTLKLKKKIFPTLAILT